MPLPSPIVSAIGVSAITSTARVREVDRLWHKLDPEEAPLMTTMMALKGAQQKTVRAEKVEYHEHRPLPRWDTFTAAPASTGDTTLSVGRPTLWNEGDLGKVAATGEIFRCTAETSANPITVTRSFGDTAAAAISAGDRILRMGNANIDGDVSRSPRASDLTQFTNQMQIFRNSVKLTSMGVERELYSTRALLAEKRREAFREHRMDMNYSYQHGEKVDSTGTVDDGSTQYMGACDGLYTLAENGNVLDFSVLSPAGRVTEDALRRATYMASRFPASKGRRRFQLWAGSLILQGIQDLGDSRVRISPDASKLGLDIREYQTPYGMLEIIFDPTLEGPYAGLGLVIQKQDLVHYTYRNHATKLYPNRQKNDEMAVKEEYITVSCPALHFARTKAVLLKNVTY